MRLSNERRRTLKLACLVGIVLVAAFLRLYQIDSIPPGDRYDPAYYGVDALRILAGARPVFFSTNFGREALFSYLVALYIALFGASTQAMYVTSAVVGIVTVPAVYLLAEELFAEEEGALRRYGGLVAALFVAVSYWHLNWSRFGVRAILVPLFAALTFFFLWRGLRTSARWAFAAAGVFLGLGAYTYQAARLFPVVVVLAFLAAILARRGATRRDVEHLALVALVALVVFAPLGAYFIAHPGSFMQRIGQASAINASQGAGANLLAAGKGVADTILSFVWAGDLEPTTNLPGRPTLNPFFSLLLLAGVVVSALKIKKPQHAFLLAWLGVLLVPAVFSQLGPIAKRSIGTMPAIALLIAVGALVPVDWLRSRPDWPRTAATVLGVLLLGGFVYSGLRTYRDYFVTWATDPDLFTHFEVGPTAIGLYAGSLPAGEPIYVSPIAPDHPAIVYNARSRTGIKGYDGRTCLVLPRETVAQTTYVVVPREDGSSLNALATAFPQGGLVAQGPLNYGEPYFLAFGIPPGAKARIAPSHPLTATWSDRIELLGYDLEDRPFRPGETIEVTLYFQALGTMETDYTAFVHLAGPPNPESGELLWGQDDSEPCRRTYPTSGWAPGEVIQDEYQIPIPEDAPPASYELRVGFYLLETLTRLPAVNAAGLPVDGDAVPLGPFRIGAEQ